MENMELTVETGEEGLRLDQFLSQRVETLSRTLVADLIRDGHVSMDSGPIKASRRLKPGEAVRLVIPPPREIELVAQDIPVTVVYEDEHLVVIDKPQGMVVHPANGNWDQTLVNALLYQVKDLSGINGELRPGIVHRLDKDTSGLLVVAKHDVAHRNLADQIKDHTARREYQALVHGVMPHEIGTIDAPVGRSPKDRKKMAVVAGGKHAVTHYTVQRRFLHYTLLRCVLETGRTHQIRVHLAYMGNPVVGDPLYGPRSNPLELTAQVLHACSLEFVHPVTGVSMKFSAPLPDTFTSVLDRIEAMDAQNR